MVDGHGERIETYEFQEVRGVGRLRENRLQRKWEHGEPALAAMRAIKRTLDPLDILNPGKIVNL